MTNRGEVLSALRTAGSAGVSGEMLAAELGVSRVAVGKHVSALRGLGYEITAVPGSGYRFVAAPDLPLPAEVRPLLASSFWGQLHGGLATGSTNDDARTAANAGAPEGSVFLASKQTAGKGRLGRSWESPSGGVYLSVVLRPRVAPAEVASLTLAVALGVARGLETLGVAPRLKWPNDVLLGEGKLAGLLHEMSAESDAVTWVVAGIGVNVRRSGQASDEPAAAISADGRRVSGELSDAELADSEPGSGAPTAAYLEDVAGPVRLAQVAAAELDGIAEAYRVWQQKGFSALRSEYEARFALVGQSVRVSDALGGVRAEGVALGVDDDGRLLVRDDEGLTLAVVAGEVTLRR